MTSAMERLLRPRPPRDRRPITPDDLVDVIEHPGRYLPDFPSLADLMREGLPTRAHMLAFYAHDPDAARRALARYAAIGRRPTPRPSPAEEPIHRTLLRQELDRQLREVAAWSIEGATGLTYVEALAVVERYGVDLHPARAERLHRRMIEEAG